jgi:hypothetical protein
MIVFSISGEILSTKRFWGKPLLMHGYSRQRKKWGMGIRCDLRKRGVSSTVFPCEAFSDSGRPD